MKRKFIFAVVLGGTEYTGRLPHRWGAVTAEEGTSAGVALPQVQREDEKQAMMAGLQQKALTSEGVEKHLVDFGLEVEAASHTTIQSARAATWRLGGHGAFRIWAGDQIDQECGQVQ